LSKKPGAVHRRFKLPPLGFRQAQGGAIVDRGPAERLLPLAASVEFVGRLIGRVEPAQGFEPRDGFVVGRHSLRLAAHHIRLDSQPLQIDLDRLGVFRLRTLDIRVIEPQNERPIATLGEKPVEQGRPGVADMDASGRRGRKPNDRGMGHFAFIEASRRRGNMV
jgi:hypothetical protein